MLSLRALLLGVCLSVSVSVSVCVLFCYGMLIPERRAQLLCMYIHTYVRMYVFGESIVSLVYIYI
jgi:hypothetical protein